MTLFQKSRSALLALCLSATASLAFAAQGVTITGPNGKQAGVDSSNNLQVNVETCTGCGGGTISLTSTDHSGTISSGGSFQVAISSGARNGCLVQNPISATETLLVYMDSAASPTTTNSFSLSPGSAISCTVGSQGTIGPAAVYVEAATTGHAFVAKSQ